MANIEDCPGFETFGADVKAARKAKRLSRKTMAEIINVDARYLANIENDGTIPSLPVVIQLIKECGLPVERYFNPEIMREESAQRQRISHKLKLCPEQYLPIIEGAIDGAIPWLFPVKSLSSLSVTKLTTKLFLPILFQIYCFFQPLYIAPFSYYHILLLYSNENHISTEMPTTFLLLFLFVFYIIFSNIIFIYFSTDISVKIFIDKYQ